MLKQGRLFFEKKYVKPKTKYPAFCKVKDCGAQLVRSTSESRISRHMARVYPLVLNWPYYDGINRLYYVGARTV